MGWMGYLPKRLHPSHLERRWIIADPDGLDEVLLWAGGQLAHVQLKHRDVLLVVHTDDTSHVIVAIRERDLRAARRGSFGYSRLCI